MVHIKKERGALCNIIILKLMQLYIGSHCKDLRVGVMCEKWEEFVMMQQVFCSYNI